MSRYLQDAVRTSVGYAHPLTGEQLTAEKGLSSPVAYYKPNGGNRAYLDPEGEIDGLVMFQKVSASGLSAKFVLQTPRTDITSISWDFDDGEPVEGGRKISHTFSSNNATYEVVATVTFVDTTTKTYDVDVLFGTIPPTNTVIPSITGTAQAGQTLTAVNGTWTGSPTFTRQWTADGTNISGATGATYVVQVGDVGKVIRVKVTGTNAGGSVTGTSNPTSTVIAA